MQTLEYYQNFSIIKQKIIKTSEVINLYKERCQELNNIKEKLTKSNGEIEKLKLENERLSYRLRTLEDDHTPISKAYDLLKTEHSKLLQDYDRTVNNLQIKYQNTCEELTQLKKNPTIIKNSPEKQLKSLNKQIEKLNEISEKFKEQLNEKNKEINKLKCQQAVSNKVKKSCPECAKITLANYEYRKEIQELKALIEGMGVNDLDLQLKAKTIELENMIKLNDTNKNKLNEVSTSLQVVTINNKELKKENNDLNNKIEEYKRELAKLLRKPEINHKEIQTDFIEFNKNFSYTENFDYDEEIFDDYRISAIMKEMEVPRLISPLSICLEVSNSKCKTDEQIDDNFDDSEKGNISCNKVENTNFITETNNQIINRNDNLLESLLTLKEANINFIISNDNIGMENYLPSQIHGHKLTQQLLLNKNILRTSALKLRCEFSSCCDSKMFCNHKDELLGFINVKEEQQLRQVENVQTVQTLNNIRRVRKTRTSILNSNTMLNSLAALVSKKLRQNNYCKWKTKQKMKKLKSNLNLEEDNPISRLLQSNSSINENQIKVNNIHSVPPSNIVSDEIIKDFNQYTNDLTSDTGISSINTSCNDLTDDDFFENLINENEETLIQTNNNTTIKHKKFDSSRNDKITIKSTKENVENSIQTKNKKDFETSQSNIIENKNSKQTILEKVEINSKRNGRKRKSNEINPKFNTRIRILKNMKKRLSTKNNISDSSSVSRKLDNEETQIVVKRKRLAHTPKHITEKLNNSPLETYKSNSIPYSCQSPDHSDYIDPENKIVIIPLERISEEIEDDSLENNTITEISNEFSIEKPINNSKTEIISSTNESRSVEKSNSCTNQPNSFTNEINNSTFDIIDSIIKTDLKSEASQYTSEHKSTNKGNRSTVEPDVVQETPKTKSCLNPRVLNTTTCLNDKQKITTSKKIRPVKVERLFEKLLNYAESEDVVNEVAEYFKDRSSEYIAKLILMEVSKDCDIANSEYSPAPMLTRKQRILLGFMSKLENMNIKSIYDNYLNLAEIKLISTDSLQVIEPVLRLYLAICKLRYDLDRMRRFCCDLFYFTGNLAVPIFFIILTSWNEILPLEVSSQEFPLAKVLVQIVYLKTINKPGYNLLPLRDLLIKFYGYPTERWNSDDFFKELYDNFLKNPTRSKNYAILLLCKNCPEKFVNKKINEFFIPLIDKINSDNFKATIIILIGNLSFYLSETFVAPIKEYLKNLITDSSSNVVRQSVELTLRRLEKTK